MCYLWARFSFTIRHFYATRLNYFVSLLLAGNGIKWYHGAKSFNKLRLSMHSKEYISTNRLIDINRLFLLLTCTTRPPNKSKSVNWMTKLLSQILWINHFCENAKTNNWIQSTRAECNDNNNFFNWKKRGKYYTFSWELEPLQAFIWRICKIFYCAVEQQTQNNKQNCQLECGKKSVVCLFANEHNTHKFLFLFIIWAYQCIAPCAQQTLKID